MKDIIRSFIRILTADPVYAELERVCYPGQAEAMIEHLTEMAKMGYDAKSLATIAHAAEYMEILAFEYGRVRLIGRSRTIQEINEEGWL